MTRVEILHLAVRQTDEALGVIDRLRHTVEDVGAEAHDRAEDLNDIRGLLVRQRVRLARQHAMEKARDPDHAQEKTV